MKDRSQLGVARAERASAGLIPLHIEPKRKRLRYEVIGLGVLGLGILLLANLHSPSGYAGYCLGTALSFLFGVYGARFLAASLTGLGFLMVFRRKHLDFRRLGVGYGLLFWIGLAMLQLAWPSYLLIDQHFGDQPGGLFGMALAAALRPIVGRSVGMVVLSLAALCTLGFVTDTPLIDMFSMAFRVFVLVCVTVGRGIGSLLCRSEEMEPEPEPEPVKLARPRRRPVEPPVVLSRVELEPEPASEPEPEPAPAPRLKAKPSLELFETPEDTVRPAPSPPKPGEYQLPPLSLLTPPIPVKTGQTEDYQESAGVLERALFELWHRGPRRRRRVRPSRYPLRNPPPAGRARQPRHQPGGRSCLRALGPRRPRRSTRPRQGRHRHRGP